MTERILSKEEKKYISKAYGATQVFGIYFLNLFILIFVISIGILYIASINENDAVAAQLSKMFPVLVLVCVLFLYIFIKGVRLCKNKNAVKRGRYIVVEGVAEQYVPYKISGGGKSSLLSNGEYIHENVSMTDGKIIFCDNDGTKESDWIPLKYKTCPKGTNLGEFPVLLIKLTNGEKFAVTDWNKIKNNSKYTHIKPFMILS